MPSKAVAKSQLKSVASRAVLFAAACAFVSPATLAQDAGSAEVEVQDDDRRLSTVTVVAQKREQDILDVPAAVSAVSDEMLEQSGVTDFSGLQQVSPSLTIDTGSNANNSSINLRGIGTYAFSIGVEPSVSVIVDDVPVVQQAQAFSTLADIERVEVLRGPQGTLFGKNASAGVINIVTKAPSNTLTGSLSATFTDDDEQRYNASLSGPINDAVGFRLNAYTYERDGHINNLADNTQLNGDEGSGVRVKLVADVTDRLTAQFVADFSETKSDGTASTFRDIPTGAALFGLVPAAAFTSGITPGEGNFNARLDDKPVNESEQSVYSFKLSYELGDHELVSVTSYQDWSYRFGQDLDNTDFNLVGALTGGAASGGIYQSGPFSADQFTQELRLVSPPGDLIDYLFGIWYSDAETSRSFQRGPIFAADWEGQTATTNYAAFGQATWHISDQWDLAAGARLSKEEIEVGFTDNRAVQSYSGDDSESAFTGKVSLQRFFDNGLTAFVGVSTGYKGQGYDVSSGFDQSSADNPVKSETSVSYEAGLKGRILDDRLQFNLVAFLTDYEDFQAQAAVVDGDSGLIQLELNNVGELRTQGIEFDMMAQLNRNWRVDASAALIDASIESFVNAQCYPGQTPAEGCVVDPVFGPVQDLSGEELSNSPDVKFTLGATFESGFLNTDWDFLANANYRWQDEVNFDLFANPRTTQDAYGILNFNVGVTHPDGLFSISAFVNNVTDEFYVSTIGDSSGIYSGTPVLTQIVPRTAQRYAGVRLKAAF